MDDASHRYVRFSENANNNIEKALELFFIAYFIGYDSTRMGTRWRDQFNISIPDETLEHLGIAFGLSVSHAQVEVVLSGWVQTAGHNSGFNATVVRSASAEERSNKLSRKYASPETSTSKKNRGGTI